MLWRQRLHAQRAFAGPVATEPENYSARFDATRSMGKCLFSTRERYIGPWESIVSGGRRETIEQGKPGWQGRLHTADARRFRSLNGIARRFGPSVPTVATELGFTAPASRVVLPGDGHRPITAPASRSSDGPTTPDCDSRRGPLRFSEQVQN